jgi:hypothetical protein
MAVPMAAQTHQILAGHVFSLGQAAVAWPQEGFLQLRLDHALDEMPHSFAHPGFDRIKPVLKKLGTCVSP